MSSPPVARRTIRRRTVASPLADPRSRTAAPAGAGASSQGVQLVGVTKRFGDTVALRDVDLSIAAGEQVAVMGPSGSGKSTLAHLIAGLLVPDAGHVLVAGRRIDRLGESARSRMRLGDVGLVFQSGHLLADLTAVENVALPAMCRGVRRRPAVRQAADWFGRIGLDGLQDRRPGELSGGQAARVAILRAVAGNPKIVIADEPTAALDRSTGRATMELLVGLSNQLGCTLIVVTHDPQVAAWCQRRIDVVDGSIVADRQAVQ